MTPKEIEFKLFLLGFTSATNKPNKTKIYFNETIHLSMEVRKNKYTFLMSNPSIYTGLIHIHDPETLFRALLK